MKKITLSVIVILLVSFHAFSEIVKWKGMEMGLSRNPKWLSSYISKNNEKALRKKFELDSSEKIILGKGQAAFLETARSASLLDAQKKVSELQASGKIRLQFIYEYWEEDDEEGFTVYSIYTY